MYIMCTWAELSVYRAVGISLYQISHLKTGWAVSDNTVRNNFVGNSSIVQRCRRGKNVISFKNYS